MQPLYVSTYRVDSALHCAPAREMVPIKFIIPLNFIYELVQICSVPRILQGKV